MPLHEKLNREMARRNKKKARQPEEPKDEDQLHYYIDEVEILETDSKQTEEEKQVIL